MIFTAGNAHEAQPHFNITCSLNGESYIKIQRVYKTFCIPLTLFLYSMAAVCIIFSPQAQNVVTLTHRAVFSLSMRNHQLIYARRTIANSINRTVVYPQCGGNCQYNPARFPHAYPEMVIA